MRYPADLHPVPLVVRSTVSSLASAKVRSFLAGCLVVSAGWTTTGVLRAQAGASAIPNAVKTAPDPESQRSTIVSFIGASVEGLKSTDAALQSGARETLTSAVRVDGSASKASSGYLFLYSGVLDDALTAILQTKPSMRVRLNVAIVSAKVAADAQNIQLLDTVESLIKTESEPAVLVWALKAAQPILPVTLLNPQMQMPGSNPLVNAIVPVASKKGAIGPVVEEAYAALTVDWTVRRRTLTPAMFKTLIPGIQSVLLARVQHYKDAIPDDPILDANYALLFLTDTNSVMPVMTPAQKLSTVQMLQDLASMASVRATLAGRGEKEQLIQLLQRVSQFMQIVASQEKADPVTLNNLRGLSQVQLTTAPADILRLSTEAVTALRTIPAFNALTPPPQINNPGQSTATTNKLP